MRNFFNQHIELEHATKTSVLRASTALVVEALNDDINAIVNLKSINASLKKSIISFSEVNNKLVIDVAYSDAALNLRTSGNNVYSKHFLLLSVTLYIYVFLLFTVFFPSFP